MRTARVAMSLSAAVLFAAACLQAETLFRQDYETGGEIKPWAANAEHQVVFSGVSPDAAFSGRAGYKFELLLNGGHYSYWNLADCKISLDRPLFISGAVWPQHLPADKLFITLGYRVVWPNGPDRGKYEGPVRAGRLPASTGSFVAQVVSTDEALADAKRRGIETSGAYLAGLYLHIQINYGKFGGATPSRAVVCLDDLQISDTYPKELVVRAQAGDLQERLARAQEQLAEQPQGRLRDRTAADLTQWQSDLQALHDGLAKADIPGPAQMQPFLLRFEQMGERLAALQVRLSAADLLRGRPAARQDVLPFVCSPWAFVVPGTAPQREWMGTTLRLQGCRGETLSGTIGLTALRELRDVTVQAGPLSGPGGIIPASAIDLKVVKCWTQAGYSHIAVGPRTLVPELLVTDDALELTGLYPAVTFPETVRTTIPADTTKRFWVSLRLPEEAKPGTYVGPLTVSGKGLAPVRFEVRVRVLPFKLEPAYRDYGIFTSFYADPARLAPEKFRLYCRDLAAHGLNGLFLYAGAPETNPPVLEYLRIAQQEGLRGPHILVAQHLVETLAPQVRAAGIPVYFWTVDEPSDERQMTEGETRAQRILAAGAKAVCTINGSEPLARLGPLHEAMIWSGAPADYGSATRPGMVDWTYWQCIVENPLENRTRNGLWLWQQNLPGAWPYTYFDANSDPFDDWSGKLRGGYCTVYPTADGIIPTIQWEAYREGIQDMRYLATLEAAVARAAERPAQTEAVTAARRLLEDSRTRTPQQCVELDQWRGEVVEMLLRLQ